MNIMTCLYNVHVFLSNLLVFDHQQIYYYFLQIFILERQHFLSSIKAFTHPTQVSDVKPINDQSSVVMLLPREIAGRWVKWKIF